MKLVFDSPWIRDAFAQKLKLLRTFWGPLGARELIGYGEIASYLHGLGLTKQGLGRRDITEKTVLNWHDRYGFPLLLRPTVRRKRWTTNFHVLAWLWQANETRRRIQPMPMIVMPGPDVQHCRCCPHYLPPIAAPHGP